MPKDTAVTVEFFQTLGLKRGGEDIPLVYTEKDTLFKYFGGFC